MVYHRIAALFCNPADILPMQAVVMWKDPLFTAFLLLLTMQLVDAAQSQGNLLCNQTFLVKWVLLLLGIIFFRNNGLYIAAGLLVLLPIVYRRQAKTAYVWRH